jgi:hypothetical protein
MKSELAGEIAKAAPPLAIVATSVTQAIDWQEIVYILTALWLAVQIAWFVGVRIYRWRLGKALDGTGDKL